MSTSRKLFLCVLMTAFFTGARAQAEEITKILKTTGEVLKLQTDSEYYHGSIFQLTSNKRGEVEIKQKQTHYKIEHQVPYVTRENVSTLKINPAVTAVDLVEDYKGISFWISSRKEMRTFDNELSKSFLITFPIEDKEKVVRMYKLLRQLLETNRKNKYQIAKFGKDGGGC
ncbi:MAG: hypothetical protein JWO06_2499 [Bacteroidota bacterium]|nr:hypothetical protein [Bacteroidota bacterium]